MRRVICDESLCSGCLACIVACIDQHYGEDETDVISPRIYEKYVSPLTGMTCYHTRSCLHCEDAPCLEVCPADALKRDERGFIIPERENCIGCQACAGACPHNVPQFDTEGLLVKCDGCSVRIACGLEPACVRTCNTGALRLEEE